MKSPRPVGCRWLAVPTGLLAMATALAPCAAVRASAEQGYPVIASFSAAEVGFDVAGLCAVQGPDGIMYFGSSSLLSYDGDRWRSTPAARTYALYSLAFGPDGRLWAAAENEIGWFGREAGAWRFHSLRSQLPPGTIDLGSVMDTIPYETGALFAARDQLLYWNGEFMRRWSMPGTRRVRAVRVGNEVFVQHLLAGLYVMRNGGPQLIIPASVLGDRGVFWLERQGSGFLILTQHGFVRVADGRLEPVPGAVDAYLARHRITKAIPLPDGRLAVGTMDGGLAFVTAAGAVDSIVNEESGLPFSYADPLHVDRDDGLWVGSRALIARIPLRGRSTVFDYRAKLSVQPITRVARHEGRLVLAGWQGLYRLDPSTRTFERFGDGSWNDMCSAGSDLLIGGYRSVSRLRRWQLAAVHTTNLDVQCVRLSPNSPDQFFAADGTSIVALSPEGRSRVVVENLPDTARSIAEDPQGNLWIGTNAAGLLRWKRGDPANQVERVGEAMGVSNPPGDAATRTTADGSVLAFTSGGAWLLPRGAAKFTPVRGAPPRPVAATARDALGTGAWIVYRATANEPATIAHVAGREATAAWQPHAIEGIDRIGVPSTLFAEDSVLWIGGTHGLLRHELPDTLGVPMPRAPLIEAVAVLHDERRQSVGSAALPASTRAIHFEFALPDFGRRPVLRLETRIDGVDAGWTHASGPSRELNLPRPGLYTVRARGVAESGAAGPESVLTFSVAKPWWQTPPAIAAGVVLVLLGASGGYHLRVRTLRRRNVELEEKVRERTEELERASAAKTEFVANMSHDIRNPLNGIVGLSYALEDTRLDPRQRDLVETLRECTTYLSTLVDDVLDFASIEAGRVELRPGPFKPAELLRSIVTALQTDSIQSGATLVVETDPQLPGHLSGDAGRIQQILVNYVSNALKYAGGTIRIVARVPAEFPGEVEFSVIDQGPGLSQADQARLFTKFTRTSQARQHAIPGTGLGLASCRLLADIMGGSVGVISEPGEGACFFLRLPLVVGSERSVEPARALPNATVLLVEDTDYNADAAAAVLRRLGLGCERARSGAEALRLFAEKRFNIVLLDRNLPDMDGTAVARQMREIEGDGLRAMLLAVTAYCTPEDRACCIDAGMDAFVGKPLTPEKIRKVLLAAAQPMRSAAALQLRDDQPGAPAADLNLDLTLLRYLATGDERGLEHQIRRYVANLEMTETHLSRNATLRDAEALASSAHRLLGDARMIRATSLEQAALALENAARDRPESEWAAALAKVRQEIGRVTAALHHPRIERTA